MPVEGKKGLMIIASQNFRDEEYFETKKIFESKGITITTASKAVGEIKGMLGETATADMIINDISTDNYDFVVFVGGVGAQEYFNDEKAKSIAREMYEKSKIVAAICIAPSILANAGILKGKRATAFSSEEENLVSKGAEYTGESVTRDGKIITGVGPSAAREFGEKIAEALEEE